MAKRLSQKSIQRDQAPIQQIGSEPTALTVAFVVIAAGVVVILGFFARTQAFLPIDLPITQALQTIQAGWFVQFMDFISEPGFPPQVWILSALIVLILFVSGLKWAAAAELVGLFGVGEHWASDVLAGYLLGFIGLILTIWFYRWAQTRFGNHPERASPFVA